MNPNISDNSTMRLTRMTAAHPRLSCWSVLRCTLVLVVALAVSGCGGQFPSSSQSSDTTQSGTRAPKTLTALSQMTDLVEELKRLRNAVEEIQFNAENNKRRQYNLFEDLDRRLLSLERTQRLLALQLEDLTGKRVLGGALDASNSTTGSISPTGNTRVTTAKTETVTPEEQQTYDRAFNLLKKSKYRDAIRQFERLIKKWPQGQLADDAYYWMAEAHYVNREAEDALSGFNAVVNRYPDSERVPEALLKIGYIQYDIGAYQDAAAIFRDLLTRFPGHQVALSAKTRLRRIEQTIQ